MTADRRTVPAVSPRCRRRVLSAFCGAILSLVALNAAEEPGPAAEHIKAAEQPKKTDAAKPARTKPAETGAAAGEKRDRAAQMTADPEVRMLVTSRVRDQVIMRYGSFATEAGLSEADRMKFVDFLVQQKIAAWQAGGSVGAAITPAGRTELGQVFSEEIKAKFDYFEKTAPGRKAVDKLQKRLEVLGAPLDAKQRASLIAYLMQQRDTAVKEKNAPPPATFLSKLQLAEYEALTQEQRITKQLEARYGTLFLSLSSAVDDR